MLSVNHLSISFWYKKKWLEAVSNISFELHLGKTLSLVGESGCGKSVTALSIVKLLNSQHCKVQAQSVMLNQNNIFDLGENEFSKLRGKEIGFVFQEPMSSLNPVIKIGKQIQEVLNIHETLDRSSAYERTLDMMNKVGLNNVKQLYQSYPHELSGGMRQRIVIAMALIGEPKILIADEPTTALDVTIQDQILNLINELQTRINMGVLLITHDLGVVKQNANHVAVMYAGQIVESGSVDDIFNHPMHPYTTMLLESLPRMNKNLELKSIPGQVPPIDAIPSHCRFFQRCFKKENDCQERSIELLNLEKRSVRCLHPC